jgi:tRNA-dihydrouridine synthase
VREATPAHVPVTVKMRRGIDDSAESREKFFTILEGAFAEGAAAVTVHARTVEQKYVGPSRWEFLREVKAHAGQRVILGSGDLFSAEACVRMLRETGVDGVSVARGAIGNPWIFAQCRALWAGRPLPPPPDVHEQRDVLRDHAALAREASGDRCLASVRKVGIKYARLHPRHEAVRNAFAMVRSLDEWDRVVAEYYAENGPGTYPAVDDVGE